MWGESQGNIGGIGGVWGLRIDKIYTKKNKKRNEIVRVKFIKKKREKVLWKKKGLREKNKGERRRK